MGSLAVHETEGVMRMIQIEMEMPKNCMDCPACNEYLMCAIPCNGRGLGENDVKDFSQSRPEWCPMKEQNVINKLQQDSNKTPTRVVMECEQNR